nr:MAG TPA: hypothetical protein [Caudoviricetes sp.]
MENYEQLKQAIANVIKTNGNQEITGAIMQNVLNTIVSTVGANRTFVGIANADTNPGLPDGNVFYIAYTAGNYVNFQSKAGNLTVSPGELAILYNGTTNWDKSVIGMSPDGVIALANITNQINATGRYAYTDTGIVRGSNAGSQKIRTFLVAGERYQITLTTVGGNAPANIQGIKADGTFDIIDVITGTPAGETKTVTPTENYYGFTIYYSPKTTATSVNVLFEVPTTEEMGLPDGMGDATNFYPDPFIAAGADIAELEGVQGVIVNGKPQYYNDRIVLPVGAFVGVLLDLSQFPYNPTTDYLNALMKISAPGTGHLLNVAFDPKTSGAFSSVVQLTADPQFDGWVSFYNVTGCSTLSNRCRVTFDNRKGTQPLTIYRCMMWTGQDVTPFGMFAKQAWDAWKKVKEIPIKTINYAPYYNEFNVRSSAKNVVITRTTLSYTVNDAGVSAVVGYDFKLADSPFDIGDVIGYGADNVVVSSATTSVMYCIFYNDSTEISRLTLQLGAGGFCTHSGTIPENTTRILIRFQIMGVGAAISVGDNYLTKGEINKLSEWERQSIKRGTTVNTTAAVVYVDAVNGNDTNPGTTESAALATFAAAFSKTGVDTTIILIGDTTERFNIKTKSNQRSVRLIGKRGLVNRIICGTKIDSGTLVAGTTNVYQTPLSSFSAADQFQLFQHEVFDESTLIPDNERHPLQRGKTYRCDSTKITRVTSLNAVKTSEGYTFFYDTGAQMLYVKIKEGTTLATNPVYIPGGSGISGNDGSVAFEMVNIECWYGSISLRFCHGGRAIDCAAKYALGGGAWSWEAAIGVELIRCEATRAFSGSTTGDGFNAHSTTTGQALAKHTVATMINCWSHDNNDDGYSDHERCETTIIGGLFEYNVKAGLTPAYGCHDTIYNAYCRKQVYSGIALVGSATEAEGGRGSQIFVIGCICENNTNNYYVSGDKSGKDENFGKFVNCISLNGLKYGYLCGANARIELNNCTDSGSPTAKSGNVIVNNAALVE